MFLGNILIEHLCAVLVSLKDTSLDSLRLLELGGGDGVGSHGGKTQFVFFVRVPSIFGLCTFSEEGLKGP